MPRKKRIVLPELPGKPIFSPSKLFDTSCWLRYKLKWIDRLSVYEPIAAPPTLGTFVHAGEAALDLDPNQPRKALDVALRRAETEVVKGARMVTSPPLVQQLVKEARLLVSGGTITDGKGNRKSIEPYLGWKSRMAGVIGEWSTPLVEARLYVDIGPVVAAPKLDLAIEMADGIYVVERKGKSSGGGSASDNADWIARYQLDNQLLLQTLALEKHLTGRRVVGAQVWISPYSRQKRKGWTSDLPQPLSSARRLDPQFVARSPHAEALYLARLEDLVLEVEQRTLTDDFPATGITNGICRLCEFRPLCRGQLPPERLKPKLLGDVDRFEIERAGKQKQKARHVVVADPQEPHK